MAIGKIINGQRPGIPPWLAMQVVVPQPSANERNVTALRHKAGPYDVGKELANFQLILQDASVNIPEWRASPNSFVAGLLQIEEQFGTTTAFAVGILIESGLDAQDQFFRFGTNLDTLYGQITSNIDLEGAGSAKERVLLIEKARKALKPWEHSEVKHSLVSVAARYVDSEHTEVKGDCVDMAALNTYLFLRAGIPAGIQTNFEHADSLLDLDGVIYLYKSSEIARDPIGLDRFVQYQSHPYRLPRNFLGVIAQIIIDRANLYGELDMLDDAHTLYERARAIDNTHPEIYAGLGQIAGIRGEINQALILLSTAVELGSENPAVFEMRGDILYESSDRDLARVDYKFCVEVLNYMLEKEDREVPMAELLLWRGEIYLKLEDFTEAAASFRAAQTTNPDILLSSAAEALLG